MVHKICFMTKRHLDMAEFSVSTHVRSEPVLHCTTFRWCAGADKGAERPPAFSGDLTLDGLRVNQLKLSRNLTGSVLLSNEQFRIRAKVRVSLPASTYLRQLKIFSAGSVTCL